MTRLRLSIEVDQDTKDKLDQILSKRPRTTKMSHIAREAFTMYIDSQADIIGSRQHFNRTLKQRLDQLETSLANYLDLLIFLNANGFAQLSASPTSPIPMGSFIRASAEGLVREGKDLRERLQTVWQRVEEDQAEN